MKANELRFGNIVFNPNLFKNTAVDILDIYDLAEGRLYKDFLPIPLTEEWLLKFGFVKINHSWSLNDGSMTYHYEVNGDDRGWCLYFNGRCFTINEPKLSRDYFQHNKYVHQLQNLYFALTGKELTIKTM